MPALMSILEELSEQMQDGDGTELGRGALLRSLAGTRMRQEFRKEHREETLEKLFTVAGTAYVDLLTEKVKEEIERTNGEQLNKLSKIIAVSAVQRWTTGLEVLQKKEEFKEQIFQEFSQTRRKE